jgi:hypothetical protein
MLAMNSRRGLCLRSRELTAGNVVRGHGSFRRAGGDNHALTRHQRRRSHAVIGNFAAELLDHVFRPPRFARLDIDGGEHTFASECEDTVSGDRGRCARTISHFVLIGGREIGLLGRLA